LSYAYENVPFYRRRFEDAGVRPGDIADFQDLNRLPLISKEDVIADQEAHPPIGDLAVAPHDLARLHLIAGAYYVCLGANDQVALTQMFGDAFRTLGVSGTDVVDIASAFHWVMGGIQIDAALRAIGATVIAGGPGQSDRRMRVMRDLGVTVLQAFTPYAEELASRFERYGLHPDDLRVRLLMIGGELRDSAAKQRLEASWGNAVAREFYGASEAGPAAAECFEGGDGMHVGSHCIVELVDPDTGRQVDVGAPGEVVTTELYRRAQPFIRYRTGDISEGFITDPCACGRDTWRLRRIIGRKSEIVRVKGLFIAPAMIDQIVRREQEARWRAIIDRPTAIDRLTVQIEWDGPDDAREAVRASYVRELKSTIDITCDVELTRPGTIDVKADLIDDRRDLR
jgi:phenylacetate-CoA ligase